MTLKSGLLEITQGHWKHDRRVGPIWLPIRRQQKLCLYLARLTRYRSIFVQNPNFYLPPPLDARDQTEPLVRSGSYLAREN